MTHDMALVIVDAVGHGAGMQVRKAVDAILCERPDVWVDYRRFTDHQSRLTILRRDGTSRADHPYALDAAKWDPAHEAVANRLAPMVVSYCAPRSVIDIGCGAGYWLRAFADLGVTERVGYTQRPADGAVDPQVKTRDIAALLAADGDAHDRFDACLALEVAQYLPPDRHDAFIAACTSFSDLVVFSSRLPGAPDASRHARPLVYWARRFRKHGYLLDDRLRSAVEESFGFPRTIYDLPLVFRRHRGASPSHDGRLDAGIEAHLDITVARLQDLYQQAIWTAVRANDLSAATSVPVAVNTTTRLWVIPRWRFMGEPGPVRTVTFRTDAARWYLTDPRASIRVLENGRPLIRVASAADLPAAPGGAWMLVRDQLTIASGDGSDPRRNQRSYAVECPGFVAWAEAQTLADTLGHGL